MTEALRNDPIGTIIAFGEWLWFLLIGFIKELTNAQRALLIAEIGFASVGAYSSYLYYQPTRGDLFGCVAAVSIVLLYVGGAGAAVKYTHQQLFAWGLVLIGTLAEMFFGVMIGLEESLPALFDPAQALPTPREWAVLGAPAILEGVLPSLCALLISILLQSMVTSHLKDEERKEQRKIEALLPYICPFCAEGHKTSSALFGHFGRCAAAGMSDLPAMDKKLIVKRAVEEGNARR